MEVIDTLHLLVELPLQTEGQEGQPAVLPMHESEVLAEVAGQNIANTVLEPVVVGIPAVPALELPEPVVAEDPIIPELTKPTRPSLGHDTVPLPSRNSKIRSKI